MQDSMDAVKAIHQNIHIGSSSSSVVSDIACALTVNVSSSSRSHEPRSPHVQALKLSETKSQTSQGRESPSSPQQWKASFESLAADLTRICRKSTGSTEPMSPRYASKAPVMFQSLDMPSSQFRPISGEVPGTPLSRCAGGDCVPSQYEGGTVGNRPIRVRHEETEFRLKKSLTAICGGAVGSTTHTSGVEDGPPGESSERGMVKDQGNLALARGRLLDERRSGLMGRDTTMKKSPQLQLKESLKSGARLKVDLEAVGGVENLAVCASSTERCVKVYCCQSEEISCLTIRDSSLTGCNRPSSDGSLSTSHSGPQVSAGDPCSGGPSAGGQEDEAESQSDECGTGITFSVPPTDHGTRLITTGYLSELCNISILTATVVGNVLYVRERPKAALLSYVGASSQACSALHCSSSPVLGGGFPVCGTADTCACIPLIYEDEASMRFTIVLHISEEYYRRTNGSSLGLLVKTVDDTLFIKGQGVESTYHLLDDSLKLFDECGRKRFSVAMKLPQGSDSRSVCAELSPSGQLIVHGRLSPASRRMTCDF